MQPNGHNSRCSLQNILGSSCALPISRLTYGPTTPQSLAISPPTLCSVVVATTDEKSRWFLRNSSNWHLNPAPAPRVRSRPDAAAEATAAAAAAFAAGESAAGSGPVLLQEATTTQPDSQPSPTQEMRRSCIMTQQGKQNPMHTVGCWQCKRASFILSFWLKNQKNLWDAQDGSAQADRAAATHVVMPFQPRLAIHASTTRATQHTHTHTLYLILMWLR